MPLPTASTFWRNQPAEGPPSEAITAPRGSVTRNTACSSEICDHKSLAVSRMVA